MLDISFLLTHFFFSRTYSTRGQFINRGSWVKVFSVFQKMSAIFYVEVVEKMVVFNLLFHRLVKKQRKRWHSVMVWCLTGLLSSYTSSLVSQLWINEWTSGDFSYVLLAVSVHIESLRLSSIIRGSFLTPNIFVTLFLTSEALFLWLFLPVSVIKLRWMFNNYGSQINALISINYKTINTFKIFTHINEYISC